ncbi:hypothetical protein AVDCRST_MAG94-467 [uncultured Leptolyngbya sp.]|uniref:Uncharacterized protein n=1 Tax=uncultured Leptolyngbya sp. TaxID=332963 RepID=A0A6J4KDL3_9CYAN|nr:hypothetical protein AVDCRST_MAG94-467 [uncultured Leptolyngbya sp.]
MSQTSPTSPLLFVRLRSIAVAFHAPMMLRHFQVNDGFS